MTRRHFPIPLILAAILISVATMTSAEEPTFNRKEDVIYGRKYGTALTMDVFTPKKDAKGIGVDLRRQRWLLLLARGDQPFLYPTIH